MYRQAPKPPDWLRDNPEYFDKWSSWARRYTERLQEKDKQHEWLPPTTTDDYEFWEEVLGISRMADLWQQVNERLYLWSDTLAEMFKQIKAEREKAELPTELM